MENEMTFTNIKRIKFNKKPIPISADYRPLYKIAQIILVLKFCCRKGTSSLTKLHFFSWAMKSEDRIQKVLELIENKNILSITMWRFEPSLNRALSFAVAEGLVEQDNINYRLTAKGENFVEELMKNPDMMVHEKSFVKQIKKQVTETLIKDISRRWEIK